ncbi:MULTISPECIES: OmpA family protein [unclassified Pseudodesulfovibrio]|uniref:OmpA family protein n=1 Tax=unclassified Pseudodesulfovibrio TaxID=2661612 RepID=UPI000FEB6B67|nr:MULTISPECIES: OmpA family protein [unclassified Pseudodesulfovibrio]MCJ2163113.1 OmpA family protein [Pseudodesulfovibrio sp. S3-i]RWU07105.1 OmpA family protein [Pseudodesulfovibrio sp. S3]
MKKVLFFALLLTISACSHVDLSLNNQTKVYSDAPVRKSPLQVSVYPKGKQYRPLTAYFHPFVIQQESSDYASLSQSFAQIFFNAWTEEQLFTTMELQPGVRYQGLSNALGTARRRGADLLILGKIPYFYAGHTLDDTAITIQMDIYAADSGTLVWTMMQSGRIESREPDDYFYFTHETRLPQGGFNKIIHDIAKDMAIPLKGWLPDPNAKFNYAMTPEAVKSTLAPTEGQDLAPEPPPAVEGEAVRPLVKGVDLNILFDFDKATIKAESYPILDALGESMNSVGLKGKSIIIGGHTDSTGDAQYNLGLSKKRAESVKTYLVQKWSIDPAMIEAVGYGNSRPVSNGSTPQDMQRNRRVEIRLAN